LRLGIGMSLNFRRFRQEFTGSSGTADRRLGEFQSSSSVERREIPFLRTLIPCLLFGDKEADGNLEKKLQISS
jgi:hypothetical protein